MSPTRRWPGLLAGEVPSDQVRGRDRRLAGHGGALIGAWLHGPQSEFAHQVGDQPHRALVAFPVQRAATRRQPEVCRDASNTRRTSTRQPPATCRGRVSTRLRQA